MRIIIAGDGKVGLALTRLLSQEGHDLVTIDSNRAVLERDMQQFDVMTVVGQLRHHGHAERSEGTAGRSAHRRHKRR